MPSPKSDFARAAAPRQPWSAFWMLVWAIATDDDRQSREQERRRKCEAAKEPPRRPTPPAGPTP